MKPVPMSAITRRGLTYPLLALISVLLVLPCASSAQKFTFFRGIDSLMFGVRLTNARLDSSIPELKSKFSGRYDSAEAKSLPGEIQDHISPGTSVAAYQFKTTQSPFPGIPVDSIIMGISVGMMDGTRKIADLDWKFEFSSRKRVNVFMRSVDHMFSSIHAFKKSGGDTGKDAKVIQYIPDPAQRSERITIYFFYGRSEKSGWYQVRCLPSTIFLP